PAARRRRLLRDRRPRRRARPRLRRGLRGRNRPQLRDGRGRPADRAPGNGRGPALQPSRAGGDAGARGKGHRRADRRPEGGAAAHLSSRRLVLATGNPGKLREYQELLGAAGYEISPFPSGVEETGSTYAENATLKALAALEATGLASL